MGLFLGAALTFMEISEVSDARFRNVLANECIESLERDKAHREWVLLPINPLVRTKEMPFKPLPTCVQPLSLFHVKHRGWMHSATFRTIQ